MGLFIFFFIKHFILIKKFLNKIFFKNSEKKLVRYYESKVVSTKGERYFEYKTEEDEELAKEMKKTFINLKPARKYRFH